MGDLLVLGAVAVWGCNAIFTKRIIHAYDPFQVALFPMLIMSPLAFAAALGSGEKMFGELTPEVLGALAYQSLLTASFGFVMWNTLQRRYGVVALHSFVFLVPISGVSLGGLILGEPVGTIHVMAALILIVLGIVLVGRSN